MRGLSHRSNLFRANSATASTVLAVRGLLHHTGVCSTPATFAQNEHTLYNTRVSADGAVDFQRGSLQASFELHDEGRLMLDLDQRASSLDFSDISVSVSKAPLQAVYAVLLKLFHDQIARKIGAAMNQVLRQSAPKAINALLSNVPSQVRRVLHWLDTRCCRSRLAKPCPAHGSPSSAGRVLRPRACVPCTRGAPRTCPAAGMCDPEV